MTDNINTGFPSDRFLIKWYGPRTDAPRMLTDDQIKSKCVVNWRPHKNSFPCVTDILLNKTNSECMLTVAIPANFQLLKKQEPKTALSWRQETNKVFSHYFNNGWQVDGFFKNPDKNALVHYYIMSTLSKS
jgi:predicted GNAT superfamily acetyltransferase